MLKDQIYPTADLHKKATEILARVSTFLEITAVDVGIIMTQTPTGPAPAWAIIYYAKSPMIGEMIPQMTLINTPFINDAELEKYLTEGCDMIRAKRQSLMNGREK